MRALLLCTGLTLLLGACGSSDSDDDDTPVIPPAPAVITGVFLDSPVMNIGYSTATQSGNTNAMGEFSYVAGEEVTFAIGDLVFPSTMAMPTVTPLNIAGSEDVTDSSVINMIRLLQTLDQDGNPDNGITITQTAIDSASVVDFSQSVDDFASSSAVTMTISNGGQDDAVMGLVSEQEAIAHFNDQLLDNDVTVGITGTWLASDDENDLLLFMFFNDGTYVHMEVDESDTEETSGAEWGTYQRDASSNLITVTQTFDENGDTGLTDFVGDGAPFLYATLIDDVLTATIDENGNDSIDATVTFNRQPNDGIVGTWKALNDDNDILLLHFMANGQYVHFEVDDSDPQEESGMEWGNYSLDTQTGRATATQVFDSNSDTGLTGFTANADAMLFMMADGNVLTLTVDEDGDGMIDETLMFERR